MSQQFMIYGANGFTGRLIAEAAVARGWKPILAGRNATEIGAMAESLGCEGRIFPCGDSERVRANLQGIALVLHCAGPFSATSASMVKACLAQKVHYLDITGEIAVFERILSRSADFQKAGIVAIPGVGFDVVPSDCLAALLRERLSSATELELILKPAGRLSPGTLKTMVEGFHRGTVVRRNGKIVILDEFQSGNVPFAGKKISAVGIAWGDISTAYHTTKIPNIRVYLAAGDKQIKFLSRLRSWSWLLQQAWVQQLLQKWISWRMRGPELSARAGATYSLWGVVRNPSGNEAELGISTPNGYDFTVDASLAAVERILSEPITPGAYTPALAFGSGFAASLPGVIMIQI